MSGLFPLGRIVATPDAIDALTKAGVTPGELLLRHVSGDWGDVDREDAATNNRSVRHGMRVLSSYPLPNNAGKLWVITEADRSSTCILTPADY